MKRALTFGGVIATQGECLWLHLPLITTVLQACAEVFASVDYAFTTVPSYPSGQIGFILASNEERGACSFMGCFVSRLATVECSSHRTAPCRLLE